MLPAGMNAVTIGLYRPAVWELPQTIERSIIVESTENTRRKKLR